MMLSLRRFSLFLLCQILVIWWVIPQADSWGADWSEWRGPTRDGQIPTDWLPEKWPIELKPLWQVKVGIGHSSPIVVGETVYLQSRFGENEVLQAYSLKTGEWKWEQGYSAPYKVHPAAEGHGAGPKSTPWADETSIVTVGIGGNVTCWDVKSQKLRWQKDFTGSFSQTSPLYGTAASPIVHDNAVIVSLGGHDEGATYAFYLRSGDVKWNSLNDGPAYASPVLAEIDGTNQLLTQTQKHLVGLSPDDGKLLWSRPFSTPYDQNSITPITIDNQVLLAGTRQRTSLVAITKQAGRWHDITKWSNEEIPLYMSTPVTYKQRLFGFSERQKGHLFCADVSSGNVYWSTDGRMGDNASLFVSRDHVVMVTTDGLLHVYRAQSKNVEELHRYQITTQPVWASPAFAPGMVVVKDVDTLSAWSIE
ncbi:MAG: PQQ-binding-like beta-propeller repeat protein [Planctomycetota bacterium]|nr:PQQ-binding-like beta-propeller repeat protein [Planctomycetota bacterium]MDA1211963.1 PQQ-binding-like beta-propeller repeat protein [Planctomycetota bacterium]